VSWWVWVIAGTLIALLFDFAHKNSNLRYFYYGGIVTVVVAVLAMNYLVFAPVNAEKEFLHFVPSGEQGAPRDMEYLVDEAMAQSGYYNTGYIPGKIVVTPNADGSHTIDWTINGEDFRFTLSPDGNGLKYENSAAQSIVWYEYGATPPN